MDVIVHSQGILKVSVSSTLTAFVSERRFDKSLTIGELKGKLELITGCSCSGMMLEAYSKDDQLICSLKSDDAMLGSYPIDDGMRLHVINTNSSEQGAFTDTSQVEKYTLSDANYDEKQDTVRSFLKQRKLGKFDPEKSQLKEELAKQREADSEEALKRISVNSRCEVTVPGQMVRRGTVKYIGETDFKSGFWVGVQYDEPYGKHDGTVQGKQYFKCDTPYGAFVRPKNVKCGEFPELGIDEDDEM